MFVGVAISIVMLAQGRGRGERNGSVDKRLQYDNKPPESVPPSFLHTICNTSLAPFAASLVGAGTQREATLTLHAWACRKE